MKTAKEKGMKNKDVLGKYESKQDGLSGYYVAFNEAVVFFDEEEIKELEEWAFYENVIEPIQEYLLSRLEMAGAQKEASFKLESILKNNVKLSLIAEKMIEEIHNRLGMNTDKEEKSKKRKNFEISPMKICYRRNTYTVCEEEWKLLKEMLWKACWSRLTSSNANDFYSLDSSAHALWNKVVEECVHHGSNYTKYYSELPRTIDRETLRHRLENLFSPEHYQDASEQDAQSIQMAFESLKRQLMENENECWLKNLVDVCEEIVDVYLDYHSKMYSPEVAEKLARGENVLSFVIKELPIVLYNEDPAPLFMARAGTGAVACISQYNEIFYMEEDLEEIMFDIDEETAFCEFQFDQEHTLQLYFDHQIDSAYLKFYERGVSIEPKSVFYPKGYLKNKYDIEGYWGVYWQQKWCGFYLKSYEYDDDDGYDESELSDLKLKNTYTQKYDEELSKELKQAYESWKERNENDSYDFSRIHI